MTHTVWKYTIPIQDDPTNIATRAGAEFLNVEVAPSGTEINVWALVDTDAHVESRSLIVRGTGQPVPVMRSPEGKLETVHVGSTLDRSVSPWTPLVWHVFETGVFS